MRTRFCFYHSATRKRLGDSRRSTLAGPHGSIFVDPASAAPIAGVLRAVQAKMEFRFSVSWIPEGGRIVCSVTGHERKDPKVVGVVSPRPVAPNESEVWRALKRRGVDSAGRMEKTGRAAS